MAMNPLEKKARSSFWKGFILALLIGLVGIAGLALLLMQAKGEEKQRVDAQKNVYVLTTSKKSGETIGLSDLKLVTADGNVTPSNAFTTSMYTEKTEVRDANNNVKNVDMIAKIAIDSGTIVTEEMVSAGEDEAANDLRLQEYNMIAIPTQISTGDVVDVRIRMPSGLDYIVISKKSIEVPLVGGIESNESVWMKLSEADTLAMSNAIVEAYALKGATLYLAKYTEPGLQTSAIQTYEPSANVQYLMAKNPNIVQQAKNALFERYNDNNTVDIRSSINGELNAIDQDTKDSNIETSVQDSITRSKEERQKYLDGMIME